MPNNLQMGFTNLRKNVQVSSIKTSTKLPVIGVKQPKTNNININSGKLSGTVVRGGGGGGCRSCGGR
jgi:hypothetical protein